MHRRALAAALVALLATFGAEARAQDQTSTGYHRHDGFFLRFTPGLTLASSAVTDGVNELTMAGGGMSGSFAIGGAIAQDLVLCGELSGFSIWEPRLDVNGVSGTLYETAWGMEYLGVGLSWYLASNLYLHGGLGVTEMGRSDRWSSDRDDGVGAKFMVGKEWWVSENWGLGLAGHLLLSAFREDDEVSRSMAALGLAFSATYN